MSNNNSNPVSGNSSPLEYDPRYILQVRDLRKYFPIKDGMLSRITGYVKAVDYIDDGLQGEIKITLKYLDGKQTPVIAGLKRISKPGLRVYARSEELPKVLGGLGIAIISTSKGLMTDKEARKNAIGGEVLAYIW